LRYELLWCHPVVVRDETDEKTSLPFSYPHFIIKNWVESRITGNGSGKTELRKRKEMEILTETHNLIQIYMVLMFD
jgi:hypothetical protein